MIRVRASRQGCVEVDADVLLGIVGVLDAQLLVLAETFFKCEHQTSQSRRIKSVQLHKDAVSSMLRGVLTSSPARRLRQPCAGGALVR